MHILLWKLFHLILYFQIETQTKAGYSKCYVKLVQEIVVLLIFTVYTVELLFQIKTKYLELRRLRICTNDPISINSDS